MKPGARIQSTLELLEEVLRFEQPADRILQHYFKARRFIGSKDRRFISGLIYRILRHYAPLRWWLERLGHEVSPRSLVVAALSTEGETAAFHFTDGKYACGPLTDREQALADQLQGLPLESGEQPDPVRYNYPDWLDGQLKNSLGDSWREDLSVLNGEAPTDLRVNTLKTTREQLLNEMAKEGYAGQPTPCSPLGIRLHQRIPLQNLTLYRQGWCEVQDEGSQLVSLFTEAKPGDTVIDYCAGAGGKTLALAALMQNQGKIVTLDTDVHRLQQLPSRLKRAGVTIAESHTLTGAEDPILSELEGTAGIVLVDAPCSGTGTWRRNPDLKWRLTPERLAQLISLQQEILTRAAKLVRPGGRLFYATCSLLPEENAAQKDWFLRNVDDFFLVPAGKIWENFSDCEMPGGRDDLIIKPHEQRGDGFFAVCFERKKDSG